MMNMETTIVYWGCILGLYRDSGNMEIIGIIGSYIGVILG